MAFAHGKAGRVWREAIAILYLRRAEPGRAVEEALARAPGAEEAAVYQVVAGAYSDSSSRRHERSVSAESFIQPDRLRRRAHSLRRPCAGGCDGQHIAYQP